VFSTTQKSAVGSPEIWALGLWLLAIVVTGGGSSPLRLALVVLPLLLFRPSLSVALFAFSLATIPSILELSAHGHWVGPLGLRLFLAAAFGAASFAFCLGGQLQTRPGLHKAFSLALPGLSALMLVHALLRQFELVSPDYQYLSGNHQSALITALISFAFALRMAPFHRLITLILLVLALVCTGSRWGIFVGVIVLFVVAAMAYRQHRAWLFGLLIAWFGAGVWAVGFTVLSKGTIIRSLMPLAFRRPWTGIGPGGVETLSLQYLTRYRWQYRQTHGESIAIDWPATYGVPIALIMLGCLLALVFWRLPPSDGRSERLQRHFLAVGLLGLLLHDLFDFSLASGAVGLMAAVIIGALAPGWQFLFKPMRTWLHLLLIAVLAGLLLASNHYSPLVMEREGRLDSVSQQWGTRSFRYWINKSQAPKMATQRMAMLGEALRLAPGDPYLWFRLGGEMLKSGHSSQAVLAYRSGLSTVPNTWSTSEVRPIFEGQPAQALAAVDGFLGASRMLAHHYRQRSSPPIEAMVALSVACRDRRVDEELFAVLQASTEPKENIVPELWNLLLRGHLSSADTYMSLKVMVARDPQLPLARLFLGLVEQQVAGCSSLAHWDLDRVVELLPMAESLRRICWHASIGNSAVLKRLSLLVGLER
jgi:hypothetical protein